MNTIPRLLAIGAALLACLLLATFSAYSIPRDNGCGGTPLAQQQAGC